jgi:hypothetical protein
VVKKIFITARFEGIHQYTDAPEEVSFLRYPHRHIFHVRITIEVFHNERDLEFIMVKREVGKFINGNYNISSGKSCETMAEELYHHIRKLYGQNRRVSVEVNEDNENGLIVRDVI